MTTNVYGTLSRSVEVEKRGPRDGPGNSQLVTTKSETHFQYC